jgi:hypothetical protein
VRGAGGAGFVGNPGTNGGGSAFFGGGGAGGAGGAGIEAGAAGGTGGANGNGAGAPTISNAGPLFGANGGAGGSSNGGNVAGQPVRAARASLAQVLLSSIAALSQAACPATGWHRLMASSLPEGPTVSPTLAQFKAASMCRAARSRQPWRRPQSARHWHSPGRSHLRLAGPMWCASRRALPTILRRRARRN